MKAEANKVTKPLAVATGLITAAAASTCGVTKFFIDTALDREKPKTPRYFRKKLSGSRKENDYRNASREAAQSLAKSSHEVVRIKSFDDIDLKGHWFISPHPQRIIIAMHGWRSSWNHDFGLIADFWIKNGCSVLFAEQRGQNGSGGDYMGFGMIERFDCRSWCEWAAERDPGLPIYLAGVSMGAASVLMAANLPLSERVHGIISDCGFTSARAIWKHVINNNLHLSYDLRSSLADHICRRKIQMSPDQVTTTAALAETNIPVLFIHGSNDHFVPVSMTYQNYNACHSDKKLLIVPGADHCMSYYLAQKEYERITKDFWRDHD